MNSASKTWRLRDVALAAGMKPRALRQSFEIGALKLNSKDRKSSGSGSAMGLSRQRAYQAATMRHLQRLGLSIPHAARLSYEFSDSGNIGRAPGELFDHGKTMLVFEGDAVTVRNIFPNVAISDISNSPCLITVDLNRIVAQVDSVLNNFSSKAK